MAGMRNCMTPALTVHCEWIGKYMVRKTKEEAQETRSRILHAAGDVFWEKGVAGGSLEMIAEKAGVTRGAIYWHFKNKCDIFDALHEELHRSLLDIIMRDMETDHPLPLQQLEKLCVSLLLNLENDPHKKKVLSIFYLRCDYAGDMQCFLEHQNAKKATSAELFHRYFQKAADKGHLDKDADPCILTLSLFCYITGIVYEYLRNPDLFVMKTQAPALIRQFFKGLRKESETPRSRRG